MSWYYLRHSPHQQICNRLLQLQQTTHHVQFDKKLENEPYQTEHDELFAAIAKGDYKFADTENGAKSTMTSILGRLATYSGQIIEWDKAINSGLDLHPKVYDWNAPPPTLPNAEGYYAIATPGVTKYV